jgi:hypothetical protein
MQQRAGLLFLAKNTGRILLILNNDQRWTVPTFSRNSSLLDDAKDLLETYSLGKIIPIELYLSEDKGFEYGTYLCLVDNEFTVLEEKTVAWCSLSHLPKNLHVGLDRTLANKIIKTKIETVLQLYFV